jgi:hypothetical protein
MLMRTLPELQFAKQPSASTGKKIKSSRTSEHEGDSTQLCCRLTEMENAETPLVED